METDFGRKGLKIIISLKYCDRWIGHNIIKFIFWATAGQVRYEQNRTKNLHYTNAIP